MAKLRFTASKQASQWGHKDKLPNKNVMSVEELLQRLEDHGIKDRPCSPAQEEVETLVSPRYTFPIDGQHRRNWLNSTDA